MKKDIQPGAIFLGTLLLHMTIEIMTTEMEVFSPLVQYSYICYKIFAF